MILGRMYLKLRRDVSGAASGRICYCVGTYQMLRRDAISGTPKTPEYRYFYGNIWQIMAIKKLLQYRYILIIKQLPNYMAIWQFFYEKKHKSIIIKSQTKKRVHHDLMVHPPKTINNFTKLITYQSSSFCLPASLLHPM